MNLATVFDISAATFGLFAGAFFCVGVLHVKDATLGTIANSFWGSGEAVATELIQQKTDFIFGAILLILSFLVQVAGKFLSLNEAPAASPTSTLNAFVVGVGVPTAFVALLYIPYRSSREKARKQIAALVQASKEKV